MADASLDHAPVWDDLRTFDGRRWRGCVDILAAGYPCQPFSAAGRRRGPDDPRHLWPDIARIIDEVRPARVFLENVPNHINLGLRQVLDDLEGLGFIAACGIFSAEEAGASHRRERLFILADAEDQDGRPELQSSRQDPLRRPGSPGIRRTPVDDADDGECSWQCLSTGSGEDGGRAADAGGTGGDLAHAAGKGWRQPGNGPGAARPSRTIPRSGGDRQPVAHASSARLPGAEHGGEPGAAECRQPTRPAAPELRGALLPLHAPGPSDPRWRRILADAPHLTPAAEPEVLRVVAGVADRVDELRLAGNGVCPLAGAVAYRTLAADLAAHLAAGQ
ncbi:DNA cytosine methyltransferase [Caenispirillum bisanense]|uniref:DNA cytosine methyltransferase n=1 Tax=Caenispirillum bisanense TaxID=414052 RepID=UPI001C3ED8DF